MSSPSSSDNINNIIIQQYKEQQKMQNNNWFGGEGDISGNIDANANANNGTLNITNDNTIVSNGSADYFTYLIIFTFFYFIIYFIISLFTTLETLFFVFNTFDLIIIVCIIISSLLGATNNTADTVKNLWLNIKPFFTDITFLIYLFVFILAFNLGLYLFKNKFAISKPIVLTIIEALLYILFVIVAVVDIVQMSFNVPLSNIMENDIDNQFGSIASTSTTSMSIPSIGNRTTFSPMQMPENSCYNINSIKDPQLIHSIYNSQIINKQLLEQQYKNLQAPSIMTNNQFSSYKANMDYNNNIGSTVDKSVVTKSQLDNNVNATLKFWMDNSSNIMKQINK
jgi:hypothetical protein